MTIPFHLPLHARSWRMHWLLQLAAEEAYCWIQDADTQRTPSTEVTPSTKVTTSTEVMP